MFQVYQTKHFLIKNCACRRLHSTYNSTFDPYIDLCEDLHAYLIDLNLPFLLDALAIVWFQQSLSTYMYITTISHLDLISK